MTPTFKCKTATMVKKMFARYTPARWLMSRIYKECKTKQKINNLNENQDKKLNRKF